MAFFGFSKTIICAGDSHTAVFHYINCSVWFSGYYFKTLVVHGATASGIQNPNSKTNAKIRFDDFLVAHKNKNNTVLFQLGEVDCGFVIWYRSDKYGICLDDQLKDTLKKYQDYIISQLVNFRKIIVMSAVLPTIQDGQDFGYVANLRKEIKANLQERTNLTMNFNKKMKEFCENNNISFLDIENDCFDKNTNTVKKQLLNDNVLDHHLSNKKLTPIIIKRLNKLFANS